MKRTLILISIGVLVFLAIIIFSTSILPTSVPVVAPKQVENKDALSVQPGLPQAVEAKRQAIYRAAKKRNYELLANEAASKFSYSFGDGVPGGFAGYMRLSEETEGQSAFDIIPKLLALPYAKQGEIYVWPAVNSKTAAEWTSEDIAMMKNILSDKQIEEYRKFGSYAYYRIGIKEDGSWAYYIAGD